MTYCGIDIGGLSSYVYLTDSTGKKKWSGAVDSTKAGFSGRLKRYVRGGLKIALEAGNQTTWIYQHLTEWGAEVTVVNPAKVKLIAESRKKTDKADAKILCELLRLDGLPEPVHMPSPEARQVRELLTARRQLLTARTKLQNSVRGLLRQQGLKFPSGKLSTFKGWQELLAGGLEYDHLLSIVTNFYDSFVQLTRSIRQLDKDLAQQEKQDERVQRLQTMPKVGRIASLTLVSAIDDVDRFASSKKLIGYTGLAPTVRQSSERCEYGRISRQGRQEIRAVWVQIAHLVAIDRSRATQPLRTWFNRVAKRRGRKTAIVALARRLLVIAYQLLKHETDYDGSRLKKKLNRSASNKKTAHKKKGRAA